MQKAWVLVALLLLPLVPTASAVGPEARQWSPYNAISEVNAIAFARDGNTIAAALKPPTTSPPATGLPTLPGAPCAPQSGAVCTDLSILQHELGFARNDTVASPVPLGRSHVAVARDGLSIASIGLDAAASQQESLRFRYLRLTSGANWSATAPYTREFTIGTNTGTAAAPVLPTPIGVVMSDDGRRVAVLTAEGTQYVLRGYTFGVTLDSAFEVRANGTPRAIVASGDIGRILVAGQFPEGNFTYGGALLLPFAQAPPVSTWLDRAANNTDARAAAISRDADTLAIGGGDGRLHVFGDGSLATAQSVSLGTGILGNMTMSEDGSTLAGAVGLALSYVDITSAPVVRWNMTVSGQNITGLTMDRTGSLLVVATAGTGGGVYAFDGVQSGAIWSVAGDARGVGIDSEGRRIAYALRSAITAANLPRSLDLELAGGGKVAPQRVVAIPGNTTYELQLRNEGAATEQVVFEESAPEMSVSTSPSVVPVRPGGITRVNVTVSLDQAIPGPRVFNLTARSLTSGLVDNVTLAIAPKPTLDVKLQVNETDVLTEAGRTSEILVTIVNNGTGDSDVTLRSDQTVSAGEPWNLTVSETSLTALRGTRTSVKVLITPPTSAVNGTSSTVRFTLQGLDIFDTKQVTFRLNPDLKVDVSATGVTKFIEPGKRASYNVTVTNSGTLPREFDVFYTITDDSGRSWGVDMQAQKVRLDPLKSRTFPVTIIAPGDAQPNERVSVLVSAKSVPEQVNETSVIDNVTLYGVAVPLKVTTPTTTPNSIPGPMPLALLGIAAVLAVLLRRRRA